MHANVDLRPFALVQGKGILDVVKVFVEMGARYGEHVDVNYMVPTPTTIGGNVDNIIEKLMPVVIADVQSVQYFGCTTDI